ncbi:MAG: hypothetical protein RLZZ524_2349 [Pseudomonadota bacterium]|jgi:hypothetical protein
MKNLRTPRGEREAVYTDLYTHRGRWNDRGYAWSYLFGLAVCALAFAVL